MNRNWKWKIPHTVLERRTFLCSTSYKNCKWKVKVWWVEAREIKRGHFLNHLFCLKEIFLTFVLFQCVVYWIHFQNVDTFTYQKILPQTCFCLFVKLTKAFSIILKTMKYRKKVVWLKPLINYEILVSHCSLRLIYMTYLSKHSKNVLVKVNRTFKLSHFLCPKDKIRVQL